MRRLSALFFLCAWLLASGAHWDVVQTIAWGRMIAAYSRMMPIGEALRLTFTPDNLCGLCEFVADNKTRADAAGDDRAADSVLRDPGVKSPLWLMPMLEPEIVFAVVPTNDWPAEQWREPDWARLEPPTEPPRAA